MHGRSFDPQKEKKSVEEKEAETEKKELEFRAWDYEDVFGSKHGIEEYAVEK